MPPRSPVMDMGLCNWSEIRISYLAIYRWFFDLPPAATLLTGTKNIMGLGPREPSVPQLDECRVCDVLLSGCWP